MLELLYVNGKFKKLKATPQMGNELKMRFNKKQLNDATGEETNMYTQKINK